MPKTIAIGVITCHRPKGLRTLLQSLANQQLSDENAKEFNWHVHVVDNDLTGQNEHIIAQVMDATGLDIRLDKEATPGIPAARNATVRAAKGADALIFVDDDEEAPAGWLDKLLTMWRESKGDIVTGPVKAILPHNTPTWAQKSRFFEKDYAYTRGQRINRAFTNNTLVSRKVLDALGPSFDMRFQYTGSSDLHYFMRAHKTGFSIIWCPEAMIWEHIPTSRMTLGWVLKRGFRAGNGETMAHLYVQSSLWKILPGVLLRSAARTVVGLGQIMLFMFTGWRGLVVGARRSASGVGTLLALFGARYEEYRVIHGQ